MTTPGGHPSFDGLRVLALESRRATEVATLLSTFGGRPIVAPALREVPLESNVEAMNFAAGLARGYFDMVIFLTGVGLRALAKAVERTYPREAFAAALSRTKVVARGPKPLAVLREMQVPVWAMAPEPNTWRELIAAIDAKADQLPLQGARIAVQEYGVVNTELIEALKSRGANVVRVPVYEWALPDDIRPLQQAVIAIADGEVDVVMFTTGVQIVHLWQIAARMNREADLVRGFARVVIASIGPSTSDELRRRGLPVDLQATHPKMGVLVRDLAERAASILHAKRTTVD